MITQLMQEDVIFRLAEDAGFDDRLLANYGHLTATPSALTKFAQLIQQQEGARITDKWSIEDSGWWNSDRSVYTCPIRVGSWGARIECRGQTPESARELAEEVMGFPTASQLVAQALEKAAQYVEKYTHDELNGKNTAALVRALIDQPVEQGGDELVAEALLAAKYFIINGTALGYIRMPDKEHPDPAHNTLPLIEKALSQAIANRRGRGVESD